MLFRSEQEGQLAVLPGLRVPRLLTEASAVDGCLALCLLLRRGLLGGVGVGVVLMGVVASVLQRGRVHGHHRGRPVALGPRWLPPGWGTAVGAGGV